MNEAIQRFTSDGADVTVTISQDWIDVRTEVQPMKIDPEWSWKDPAGHTHDASLSKAVWKVVRVYWCEMCCDEHEESELVCRYCGAEVKPRRIPDYDQPTHIPGLVSGRLEVTRPPIRTEYYLTPELIQEFHNLREDTKEAWIASVEAREDLIGARDFTVGNIS